MASRPFYFYGQYRITVYSMSNTSTALTRRNGNRSGSIAAASILSPRVIGSLVRVATNLLSQYNQRAPTFTNPPQQSRNPQRSRRRRRQKENNSVQHAGPLGVVHNFSLPPMRRIVKGVLSVMSAADGTSNGRWSVGFASINGGAYSGLLSSSVIGVVAWDFVKNYPRAKVHNIKVCFVPSLAFSQMVHIGMGYSAKFNNISQPTSIANFVDWDMFTIGNKDGGVLSITPHNNHNGIIQTVSNDTDDVTEVSLGSFSQYAVSSAASSTLGIFVIEADITLLN